MARRNIKEDELKSFAEMILSADDYNTLIQQLNGKRMGLANKYGFESPAHAKRTNILKELIEAFK